MIKLSNMQKFTIWASLIFIWIIYQLSVKVYGLLYNVTLDELPVHVWMYWEDPPNSVRPGYISLALDSAMYNIKGNLQLHILNSASISEYLPDIRDDLDEKLNIPQRVDYYRAQLLYRYGGIWLDADTIVVNDLTPLMQKLRYHDFIGFGCNYHPDLNICNTQMDGYPIPSNWVMISRVNTLLFKNYIQGMDKQLDLHDKDYFENNYHALGRALLAENVEQMYNNYSYWDYNHMSSRCIERTYDGQLLRNDVLITDREIDPKCADALYFVPMYNTSPGFPEWFKSLTADEILASDTLIGKLFRKSFKK